MPHITIDPLGGDRAVVGSRAMRAAGTLMRQQAVLAHQPQDAAPAGADAGEAQPRPQLAVALAVERAVRQELPDRRHQVLVRHRPERPGPLALDRLRLGGDGGRRSPATRPRSASPAAGRRPGPWRARPAGSSPRPPACQRAGGLQPLDLRLEQLVGHRQLADLRLAAGRSRHPARRPAGSSATPRPRPGRRPASRSARRRSPRARARPAPGPRPAAAAARRPACGAPTSAAARSGVGPPPPAWWARSAGPTPTPTSSSILHLLAVLYLQSGVSTNRRPGEAVPAHRPEDHLRRRT